MTNKNTVLLSFRDAGLSIKLVDRPTRVRGASDVFSLDVETQKKGTRIEETFRMHVGKDADVQVLNVDKSLKQLILSVREEARDIKIPHYDRNARKTIDRIQHIDGAKHKYLVGMDERSYFMAEVPGSEVKTVKDAHRALKNREVAQIENEHSGKKIVRQGEWFFVPESAFKPDGDLAVHKKHPINDVPGRPMGKPHVADEIVFVMVKETVGRAGRQNRAMIVQRLGGVYVRGNVRHPDHETVSFREWHRVYRNREVRRADSRWID